ncbi:hypothetical protein [Terricaulis sp.]|uniref:hypothetical protein n=1 Tax=Terricaulis sp. TaxID=2768686 RepID=UPI002AC54CFE|nr:hypothetical protein [Terricaulis sp.]MDZ4690119.1 hypothetical protein [Terricaulis sp.]
MNTRARIAALALLALAAPLASGCALAAGAAVGAAAVDYFSDDNDVCNGPNDEGILDSDCRNQN